MATQPLTAQKKRQRILIGVLTALVVIAAGVYWLAFFQEPAPRGGGGLQEAKTIEFDFDLFNTEYLRNLPEPPIPVPLPETSGRPNPFAPL